MAILLYIRLCEKILNTLLDAHMSIDWNHFVQNLVDFEASLCLRNKQNSFVYSKTLKLESLKWS